MDKIAFAPLIDVPLAVFTAAACFWHFGRWAVSNDLDSDVNLVARLATARLRAISLFAAILLLCWLLIETGTEVTVTAYRNGRPCVTPNS